MSDCLVIIPTYNEKENIVKMIQTVLSLPKDFHVLIVDDGSPDGTGQLVKQQQELFPKQLHLLERKGKLGLGTAYIAGFNFGLKNGYDFIFEMDCDFSHNPNDLVRLYEACKHGADVAVGSRYVNGGGTKNWGLDRVILSKGASIYTRLITWMWVMDPTAGFKCYRRKVLETIDFDKIRFIGYAFQIEMKFAAHTLGFKIVEVPIVFADRVEGASKMSSGIIKEAVWGVFKMKLKSLFHSYRKEESKIFLTNRAESAAE